MINFFLKKGPQARQAFYIKEYLFLYITPKYRFGQTTALREKSLERYEIW